MTTLERLPRPRPEARMAFELLVDIIERGDKLSGGALPDQFNKFLAVSHPGSQKTVSWGWFFRSDRAHEVWTALREGFDNLRAGRPFELPTGDAWDFLRDDRDGVVWDQTWGRIRRLPSDEPAVLVVRQVFDLLTEVAPRLRVCARQDCARFFLFERPKQVYCSESCAQRVRMTRFLAERSPRPSRRRPARAK